MIKEFKRMIGIQYFNEVSGSVGNGAIYLLRMDENELKTLEAISSASIVRSTLLSFSSEITAIRFEHDKETLRLYIEFESGRILDCFEKYLNRLYKDADKTLDVDHNSVAVVWHQLRYGDTPAWKNTQTRLRLANIHKTDFSHHVDIAGKEVTPAQWDDVREIFGWPATCFPDIYANRKSLYFNVEAKWDLMKGETYCFKEASDAIHFKLMVG